VLTGSGGIGTYLLAIPGGAPFHTASETISGPANVATGFTATSNAGAGELAVIYAAA